MSQVEQFNTVIALCIYATTSPRDDFSTDLFFFSFKRFSMEDFLTLVARLILGSLPKAWTNSSSLDQANIRFMSWLREFCTFITKTPSLLILVSLDAKNLSLTRWGRLDAPMSKRRCIALETLLTCCPPAPCDLIADSFTSDSLISICSDMVGIHGVGEYTGLFNLQGLYHGQRSTKKKQRNQKTKKRSLCAQTCGR